MQTLQTIGCKWFPEATNTKKEENHHNNVLVLRKYQEIKAEITK